MFKGFRISLANKCQLLFGAAVVAILAAALLVVAQRMQTLIAQGPREHARLLADAYFAEPGELPALLDNENTAPSQLRSDQRLQMDLIPARRLPELRRQNDFIDHAATQFQRHNDRREIFRQASDGEGDPLYRYARAIRGSQLARMRKAGAPPLPGTLRADDSLSMLLLIQLRDPAAGSQAAVNRVYLLTAGVFAGLLAIGVFWFITTRLILSPVRLLRDYAQQVSEGDLNIRSDINTGDEFQELSSMFNAMLDNLKQNQDKLRSINKSLDLKLGELAQSNLALHEANKMKGQFLANVSHELRTPLNSIIGFAEVLQETLPAEGEGDDADEKRRRYLANIVTSSRQLLELITDLLDLAKIEAGRMEVRPAPVSLPDTAEGLVNLIRPQAEAKRIQLQQQIDPDLPLVQTDPGKLQQILFNFLANAVKFTPEEGTVTLAAEPADDARTAEPSRVRISVTDTGHGIPEDQQERIFEQFTQLENGVTRQQGGTGLGLTISQELARLLQGRVELDSRPGAGSTFSLTIPVTMSDSQTPLMPEESQN